MAEHEPATYTDSDGWMRWLARAEIVDVHEARRGLELDAARLAALRRSEDDLVALEAAAVARRAARSAEVVSEWAAADLALHRPAGRDP